MFKRTNQALIFSAGNPKFSIYQDILRVEESMTKVELVSRRKKQATHVHGQEVGAVAASNRDSLEQARARDAYLRHKIKIQLESL